MFVDFDLLPDDSRIWVYGSEKELSNDIQLKISSTLQAFLDKWSHHGKPLTCSLKILENRFLIIGLDESINFTGGCSMDSLQNLVIEIDDFFKLNFYERLNVFVLLGEKIKCVHSSNLKENSSISKETFFYDLNISKKIDLQKWLIPIHDGWCYRFLD